jgi:hypothetical protein
MAKVLYFSYDGLLDPLGQSQIIPYVSAISAAGHCVTIFSYEKVERTKEQIKLMEIKLQKIKLLQLIPRLSVAPKLEIKLG